MKNSPIGRSWKTFTLTEILVVLIIIGILMPLALPNLMPLFFICKSTFQIIRYSPAIF
jgi:type IV pilus assembly protein PilE